MKKQILLFALSAVCACGSYAQDAEPTTPAEVWTLHLAEKDVDPKFDDKVFTMEPTGYQKDGHDVYSCTFDLDKMGNEYKPSKYTCWVSCEVNGETKSINSFVIGQFNQGDTPVTVTLSAYINSKNNIAWLRSNDFWCAGDDNFRIHASNLSTTGEDTYKYANYPLWTEMKNGIGANFGEEFGTTTGTDVFPRAKRGAGIYKIGFEYKALNLDFEPVNTLELTIDEVLPFVCAADVTIPEGVEAFTLSYDAEAAADELKAEIVELADNTLPANTPVLLKVEDAGLYTFAVTTEPQYNIDGATKYPTFIRDTTEEGNLLVGVHQPHYIPTGCYAVDGSNCTLVADGDNKIIDGFSSYVKLPEDVTETPEAFTVVFPQKIPTGIENVAVSAPAATTTFNIMGQPVDASYKGIVIRDGKKYIQK